MQTQETSDKLFSAFKIIFNEEKSYKIVESLALREGANLREIARMVGLAHKNVARYLEQLMRKGVVESFPAGRRIRIYRLSKEYEFLRLFFNKNCFSTSNGWNSLKKRETSF